MPKFSFKWNLTYDSRKHPDDEEDYGQQEGDDDDDDETIKGDGNDKVLDKKKEYSLRRNGKAKPHNFHRFKHVGVGIRLYKDKLTPMEIFYRRKLYSTSDGWMTTFSDVSTYWKTSVDEFVRGWDQLLITNFSWNPKSYLKWPWHSLREYNARLRRHHPILSTMELNDLYSQPKLVGELVPQF